MNSHGFGAALHATGVAIVAADTVVLSATEMLPTATAVFLQGDSQIAAGVIFGDGIRCTAGSLKRLGVKISVAGAAHYPDTGDLSISARSAALAIHSAPARRATTKLIIAIRTRRSVRILRATPGT